MFCFEKGDFPGATSQINRVPSQIIKKAAGGPAAHVSIEKKRYTCGNLPAASMTTGPCPEHRMRAPRAACLRTDSSDLAWSQLLAPLEPRSPASPETIESPENRMPVEAEYNEICPGVWPSVSMTRSPPSTGII